LKPRPKLAALVTVAALSLAACSSGQELSYGEAAEGEGLEVTVLRVERGNAADLAMLQDADEYTDRTPFYVHYRVTKTTDDTVEGIDLDTRGDEGRLTLLNIMPSFPSPTVDENGDISYGRVAKFDKCTDDHDSGKFGKAPKGETYEACDIYLTDAGDDGAPTRVEWVELGEADPIAVWE
jgi:hypothetical protein